VVALNTDASVKRLKGEERPINTLEDRAAVIAALGSVDLVVALRKEMAIVAALNFVVVAAVSIHLDKTF
jgi:bifunctional ADP-heptose synthase (sugar kinase/adenylyltransferase)